MLAEKSGMLVNSEKEVVGWVLVGDEYDANEGDTFVTHHKTAEKLGLGDVFKEMKAENTPKKEKKEKVEGEKRTRGAAVALSPEMNYTVLKADFDATTDEGPRGEAFSLMMKCDNVGKYMEACSGYTHTKKDGTKVDYNAITCLRYAIKRGAIALSA